MPRFKSAAVAEKWALITYGCTLAEAVRLNDDKPVNTPGSKAQRYVNQKHKAAVRGIAWAFDFPTWLRVWDASGRWSERGIGKRGYCMARRGDVGPYSEGNVVIQLVAENSREGRLRRLGRLG